MRILFFEFIVLFGGGILVVEVDMVFICLSKGNNICWKMNIILYVMFYIFYGNEVSFEWIISGKNFFIIFWVLRRG